MKTIKLVGETYLVRREIAKLGFVFSYEENGYVGNCEELTESLKSKINLLGVECEEIAFFEINEEYIVKQKNLRAQKKAGKYSQASETTSKKAESTDISKQEREFLSLGEPVKIGHHSEKRHRKLVEKAWDTMGKRVELFEKAEEQKDKAEYWKNKKFLTSSEKAEKKRISEELTSKAIELWKLDHKAGDPYIGWHTNNELVIAKINKKTITTVTGSKWEIAYSKDFGEYLKKAQQ